MAFTTFKAFIAMGGHSAYIWTAYSIFLIAVITLHLSAKLRHKKLTAQLNALKKP